MKDFEKEIKELNAALDSLEKDNKALNDQLKDRDGQIKQLQAKLKEAPKSPIKSKKEDDLAA
jgi:chaperonin cofactor prefoldin